MGRQSFVVFNQSPTTQNFGGNTVNGVAVTLKIAVLWGGTMSGHAAHTLQLATNFHPHFAVLIGSRLLRRIGVGVISHVGEFSQFGRNPTQCQVLFSYRGNECLNISCFRSARPIPLWLQQLKILLHPHFPARHLVMYWRAVLPLFQVILCHGFCL